MPELEIVIPAAGASRRLGRPKQLVTLDDGRTLIEHAVERAVGCCPRCIHVVVGAVREPIERLLTGRPGVAVHYHADWSSGMAGSIILGFQHVAPDCRAVLVLLPDQVHVTGGDLQRLIGTWRSAPRQPVAAAYRDGFGAPAIVPRALFPEVLSLSGDRGAHAVLTNHRKELITVAMPNAAFDLDTSDDEQRLRPEDRSARRG